MPTSQELITHARALMQANQIDDAENIWRELATRHPKEPDLHSMLGVCRRLKGDIDNAMKHFRAATELDEHHADSHFHIGQTLQQIGRLGQAEKAFNTAVKSNPNHIGARVAMARIQEGSGKTDEALKSLRMALRADRDSIPALAEISRILLARGQVDEADKHASRAIQLKPEDLRAQLAVTNILQTRGHWDSAEQMLGHALKKYPDSAPLWAALGGLYRFAGRHGQAVQAFERAEQLYPGGRLEPVAVVAMAESLNAIGYALEAHQRLETLSGRVRLEGGSLLLLAELRIANGQIEAARELLPQLEKSLGSGKRLVEAWLAEAAGELESAAGQAAKLHEIKHEGVSRKARLLSARLAARRDDAEAVENALSSLVGRDPTATWMLADARCRVGDHGRGREVLEALLSKSDALGPQEQAITHARLAWLLDDAGQYESAREHVEHCSWQGLPHPARMVRATPEAQRNAIVELEEQPWATTSIDDERPQLLFVLGWPGSGGENVVQALMDAGMAHLDTIGGERRRQALGLPKSLPELQATDDAEVRAARRRYFRGTDIATGLLLDPMWFEATDLPALARFFPGARVIVPDAEAGDLELHWRLSGFGEIEQVHSAWCDDQAVLQHVRERFDLEFIDVPRSLLVDDAGKAAELLAGALGTKQVDELAKAIERSHEINPLKPAGRWQHYSDILTSAGQPA